MIKDSSISFRCDKAYKKKINTRLQKCNDKRARKGKEPLTLSDWLEAVIDGFSSGDPTEARLHTKSATEQRERANNKRDYIRQIKNRIPVNEEMSHDIYLKQGDKSLICLQLDNESLSCFLKDSPKIESIRASVIEECILANPYYNNSKKNNLTPISIHLLDGSKTADIKNQVWNVHAEPAKWSKFI